MCYKMYQADYCLEHFKLVKAQTFYVQGCRVREATKKVLFLVSRPLRGGGRVRGVPLRKNDFFFNMALLAEKVWRIFFLSKSVSCFFKTKNKEKKFLWQLSRGGGGKGLSCRANKKRTFLRLP